LLQTICVWNEGEYGYSHIGLHPELMSLPEIGPITPDIPFTGQAGLELAEVSLTRLHHAGQTCSELCNDILQNFLNYLNA